MPLGSTSDEATGKHSGAFQARQCGEFAKGEIAFASEAAFTESSDICWCVVLGAVDDAEIFARADRLRGDLLGAVEIPAGQEAWIDGGEDSLEEQRPRACRVWNGRPR
jgi:hypothetical protein